LLGIWIAYRTSRPGIWFLDALYLFLGVTGGLSLGGVGSILFYLFDSFKGLFGYREATMTHIISFAYYLFATWIMWFVFTAIGIILELPVWLWVLRLLAGIFLSVLAVICMDVLH
jgi:hypothetical protein